MPLHDWSQVEAGIFHAFHTAWIGEIQSSLNHGLLSPGKHDPLGMHEAIRAAVSSATPVKSPTPRASTLASYLSQRTCFEAFVEHPHLGQPLPPMPVFLERVRFVNVPLEETYLRAWEGIPAYWRNVIAKGSPSA